MQRLLAATLLVTAAALAQPSPPVVLAVLAQDGLSVEPVAVIENGRLVNPFDTLDAVDLGKRGLAFCDKYFAKGTTYRLVPQGTVTIQDDTNGRSLAQELATGGGGAWIMTATASAAPRPGRQRTLALSADPGASPRRAATPAEKAQLKKWLGATATDVLVRDLDHDGTDELLGTSAQKLVVLSQGKPVFTRTGRLDIVDTANLVGDGTDEIVVQVNVDSSWTYEVLGRQGGRWTSIYKGCGGGC